MRITLSLILLFAYHFVTGQITITTEELPERGTILEYHNFSDYPDSTSFLINGEDLVWDFSSPDIGNTVTEEYLDIEGTSLADSFPSANMILNLGFFQAAGIRTNEGIDIVGLSFDDFTGFGVEARVDLEDAYIFKQVPFTFGDSFGDSLNVVIQFPSDLIPMLDSIELPIPGAELDSIRITADISKIETATAWGTANLLDVSYPVLKVEQIDRTDTKFEVGVSVFGLPLWVDAGEFIDLGDFTGEMIDTTYRFVTPGMKASLMEFTIDSVQDTLGNENTIVRGRINADLIEISATKEIQENTFQVYPNPSNGHIFIGQETMESGKVFIYNLEGKMIRQSVISGYQTEINLNDLTDGSYIIRLITGKMDSTQLIQITH